MSEQLESTANPGSAPLQQHPVSGLFVFKLGGVLEVFILNFWGFLATQGLTWPSDGVSSYFPMTSLTTMG